MSYSLPIRQNPEQFRLQILAILNDIDARLPGFGSALPGSAPEGRLYTVTATNTLYQRLSGAWVAL